jgi:hypothetical protein
MRQCSEAVAAGHGAPQGAVRGEPPDRQCVAILALDPPARGQTTETMPPRSPCAGTQQAAFRTASVRAAVNRSSRIICRCILNCRFRNRCFLNRFSCFFQDLFCIYFSRPDWSSALLRSRRRCYLFVRTFLTPLRHSSQTQRKQFCLASTWYLCLW